MVLRCAGCPALLLWVFASMSNFENVPNVVRLDDEAVFHLSILRAWLAVFPAKLREHARFKVHNLHRAMPAGEISAYSLLSGAYIGFAPLPVSYRRFINEAERINKHELTPPDFLRDASARENSATEEFEMSRGEFKRLLARLDELAMECGDIASYAAVFNCREVILGDQSPFAPTARDAYAKGPLHLWDFAKAVEEHSLDDMAFGTFGDWVLFLHLENGVVSGHAIHALAHRFGDFRANPLIDGLELRMRSGGLSPIIEVPTNVQEAVRALADSRFQNQPFEFVPPPMMFGGSVVPWKAISEVRRCRTEA